jgi:hypothetical protein
MEYLMVDNANADGLIVNASIAVKTLQRQVKNDTEIRNLLLLIVCFLYLFYLYLFYRMEIQNDHIHEIQQMRREEHPLLEKLVV